MIICTTTITQTCDKNRYISPIKSIKFQLPVKNNFLAVRVVVFTIFITAKIKFMEKKVIVFFNVKVELITEIEIGDKKGSSSEQKNISNRNGYNVWLVSLYQGMKLH